MKNGGSVHRSFVNVYQRVNHYDSSQPVGVNHHPHLAAHLELAQGKAPTWSWGRFPSHEPLGFFLPHLWDSKVKLPKNELVCQISVLIGDKLINYKCIILFILDYKFVLMYVLSTSVIVNCSEQCLLIVLTHVQAIVAILMICSSPQFPWNWNE